MNELKDCLSEWTGRLSDSLTKTLMAGLTKDFTSAVSVVANSVAKNTSNIQEITETIKRLEGDAVSANSKLEQKIDRLESVFLASRRNSGNGISMVTPMPDGPPAIDIMQVDMRAREQNLIKSERYHSARCSLRLWPVRGTTDEEVWRSAIKFIREKLQVDQNELGDNQITRVRRSKPPRKSRVKFEVLVTFEDKYSRDTVSAHGRNLAEYLDLSLIHI